MQVNTKFVCIPAALFLIYLDQRLPVVYHNPLSVQVSRGEEEFSSIVTDDADNAVALADTDKTTADGVDLAEKNLVQ